MAKFSSVARKLASCAARGGPLVAPFGRLMARRRVEAIADRVAILSRMRMPARVGIAAEREATGTARFCS